MSGTNTIKFTITLKTMNKVTQEKVSSAVIKACEDEKLMYKEAAKVFNTEPLYFTYLKNPKYWDTIPQKVWDKFHTWMYSGTKLKEYKMPGSYEEAQLLADEDLKARINESAFPVKNAFTLDEIQENNEANEIMTQQIKEKIAEKAEPKIKPEALAKRKLKLKPIPIPEKPKRKYVRKPKSVDPPEKDRYLYGHPFAVYPATGTPLLAIPEQTVDNIILDWLNISPERQMIDNYSIQTLAEKHDVPFGFVKQIIEKNIEEDAKLAIHMEEFKEVSTTAVTKSLESLVDAQADEVVFLKSEIRTLAHLLKNEHEDNERLRAEVGYLNARIEYTKRGLISHLTEMYKFHVRGHWERLDKKTKEINELEDRIRAYQRRTFWDYLFNRPVR